MAKVLVVEDNPVNLKLMRKILESLGHSVSCAETERRMGDSLR